MNVETCLNIKLSEVSCTKEGLFYGMKGKLTTPLSSNTNEDRKRSRRKTPIIRIDPAPVAFQARPGALLGPDCLEPVSLNMSRYWWAWQYCLVY